VGVRPSKEGNCQKVSNFDQILAASGSGQVTFRKFEVSSKVQPSELLLPSLNGRYRCPLRSPGQCWGRRMRQVRIGDLTIDAVIEREGPWRRPQDFFPAYDEAVFQSITCPRWSRRYSTRALGIDVITYQTSWSGPRLHDPGGHLHREDKGHPPPFDFPGRSAGERVVLALGIAYDKVDYVSARIFISTIPAGTPHCATGAGCRRSRMRNTYFTKE